jgi:hypothetical protein
VGGCKHAGNPTGAQELSYLGFLPMDDDARIEEIRQKLSVANLILRLSAAAAVGMVAAEGAWTATIERENPKKIEFEAVGDTPREAAERAYDKYLELISTETTSRPKDVSEMDTSKELDT